MRRQTSLVLRRGARAWLIATIVALSGFSGSAALAAGKPEKAYLESKFHMLIPILRDPGMVSRVVGNQLYVEHSREVRAVPNLLRYTQSFPLPLYDLRSSYDGITEYFFDDFETAKTSIASKELHAVDLPWVKRITGGIGAGIRPWRPKNSIVLIKDHVMVDGYEQGYKWFNFMRRKEGVSKEQVDAYMRDKYAPALAKLPGIRRYVIGLTNRPKGAEGAGGMWAAQQHYDAVDMIWFDNLEDMQRFLGSIDYQENVQRAAELAVIDQSQTVSFAADYNERVPFPPRYQGPSLQEMTPAMASEVSPAQANPK